MLWKGGSVTIVMPKVGPGESCLGTPVRDSLYPPPSFPPELGRLARPHLRTSILRDLQCPTTGPLPSSLTPPFLPPAPQMGFSLGLVRFSQGAAWADAFLMAAHPICRVCWVSSPIHCPPPLQGWMPPEAHSCWVTLSSSCSCSVQGEPLPLCRCTPADASSASHLWISVL